MVKNATTGIISVSKLITVDSVPAGNGRPGTMGANHTAIAIDHTVAGEGDDDSDKQMVIASAIVIVMAILLICALLCYREISRRRLEADMLEEFVRKEEIKKTIKKKIAQMQNMDDSDSYREEMRLKVPLVTFGNVTRISPAHSYETLHLQAQLHHYHHHHHHHHHHHARGNKQVGNKSYSPLKNAGKEKHWYASGHKIPTRGRFLTFLFGNNKKQNKKAEKNRETKDLQIALNSIQIQDTQCRSSSPM